MRNMFTCSNPTNVINIGNFHNVKFKVLDLDVSRQI